MLRICITSIFIAAATEACCIPKKWEAGQFFTMGISLLGEAHLIQGMMHTHYDFDRKMMVVDEDLFSQGKENKTKLIKDYNKALEYTITEGKCSQQKLPGPMFNCIPAAKKIFDFYIGAGKNTMDLTSYAFEMQGSNVTMGVTKDGCIPAGVNAIGSTGIVDYMVSGDFINMTLGIKNSSVFNIPSICKKLQYAKEWRPKLSVFGF